MFKGGKSASFLLIFKILWVCFYVTSYIFCMTKWRLQTIELYVVKSTKESYNILFLGVFLVYSLKFLKFHG